MGDRSDESDQSDGWDGAVMGGEGAQGFSIRASPGEGFRTAGG